MHIIYIYIFLGGIAKHNSISAFWVTMFFGFCNLYLALHIYNYYFETTLLNYINYSPNLASSSKVSTTWIVFGVVTGFLVLIVIATWSLLLIYKYKVYIYVSFYVRIYMYICMCNISWAQCI